MTVIITDDHQGVSTVLSGHQTVRQQPTRSPPPRAASARGNPPSSVHLPHPPPPQPPSPGETYQCGNFGRRQVHHRPIQVAVHVGGVPKYRSGGGHAQGQIGREGERHGAARTPRDLAQGKGGGQGRDPKKINNPARSAAGGCARRRRGTSAITRQLPPPGRWSGGGSGTLPRNRPRRMTRGARTGRGPPTAAVAAAAATLLPAGGLKLQVLAAVRGPAAPPKRKAGLVDPGEGTARGNRSRQAPGGPSTANQAGGDGAQTRAGSVRSGWRRPERGRRPGGDDRRGGGARQRKNAGDEGGSGDVGVGAPRCEPPQLNRSTTPPLRPCWRRGGLYELWWSSSGCVR